MIMTISCLIHIVIISENTRELELKTTLDNTVKDTLETVFINKIYTINDVNELMADFCSNLMLQENANSKLTVILKGVNFEEGLIHIEVQSNFIFPNGKEKTIRCEKTVVLEEISSS